MKSIMIIGGGEDYSENKILEYYKNCDYLIVCDEGLNIADKLSIKPDLIIGDMDSVDSKLLLKYDNCEIEKFPPEKDFTDSELAINKAVSFFPEKITLFAMTGSYIDHSILNIINLRNFESNISLITANSEITIIKFSKTISGKKNRRFSLIPLTEIKNLKMNECKYQYKKPDINIFEFSCSNLITSDRFEINFEQGILIFILFDEDYK